MAGFGEVVVDAPPLRPPVYGLLQAADIVEHGPDDSHWFAGLRWRTPNNAALEGAAACSGSYSFSAADTRAAPGVAAPFDLIAHDVCSSFGWTDADYQERATEVLLAKEWAGLENEFERGVIVPTNPHLASTLAVTTQPAGTTPIPARNALAALDEAIANARIGQGMIHAPWYVVDQWKESQALSQVNMPADARGANAMPTPPRQALFSPCGNIIVAGSGYEGRDTSGNVPGSHASRWAYATGLVRVHRTADVALLPGTLREAMDRAANTVTFRASRTYAVQWSQLLHAAVPVITDYAT